MARLIPHPGHAGDVRNDVMEVQVHLGQRLLHVLNVGGRVIEQPLTLAQVCAQSGDLALRPEAAPQQPVLMQALQPLCVADVGLVSRDVLGVASIHQHTSNPRCSRIS